jgi:hypothetical protein
MYKNLKKFCREPKYIDFISLPKYQKLLLEGWAEYCVQENVGNLSLAKTVISFANPLGVKPLFLAMKLLMTPEFMSIQDKKSKKYPGLAVILTGYNPRAFYITYGLEFPEQFSINQTVNLLGVDKELVLYREDAREYFIDLFTNNPITIERINIHLNKISTRTFYRKNIGVVWGSEKCIDCFESKNTGKECQKLLASGCMESIRYRPNSRQGSTSRVPESRVPESRVPESRVPESRVPESRVPESRAVAKKFLKKNYAKKWECPVCMLYNDNNSDKCLACGTKN